QRLPSLVLFVIDQQPRPRAGPESLDLISIPGCAYRDATEQVAERPSHRRLQRLGPAQLVDRRKWRTATERTGPADLPQPHQGRERWGFFPAKSRSIASH